MKYLASYTKDCKVVGQALPVIRTKMWEFDADNDASAKATAESLFFANFMILRRILCIDHEVDITQLSNLTNNTSG